MKLNDPSLLIERCFVGGAWTGETAKERSAILRRWFELMIANKDDIALIMTSEQGKPLAEAKGEVEYAASFIEFYAEEAKRVYRETIPSHRADARIMVIRQPVGVVAAITPWNFPAAMITRKVSPAIAAGCTGSTDVGKILMRQAASTVKKVELELGGNAPFIVFDDADLDAAVEGAIVSKFRNMGQTCVCANRIYAQEGIYDDFVSRLAKKVMDLKVGNGVEVGVVQGPLITMDAVEKVERHI